MFDYLISPPHIIEPILLMLTLHDFQLILNADLPENGLFEEGHKSGQGVVEMFAGDVKVEVGVF